MGENSQSIEIPPKKQGNGHRRIRRNWICVIGLLFIVLVGFRLFLPYMVKRYVNKTLSQIQGYSGHVDDVRIHLWRGAYSVKNLTLMKTDGLVPVPFFASPYIDFSVEWMALFEGALVAKINCEHPVMNFVAGPTSETTQVGVDKPWFYVIKELFPLDINRFEIVSGSIHYRDFYSTPRVDLKIDQIHLLGYNLTNSKRYAKTLVAKVDFDGRAFESNHLWIRTQLDPSTARATFNLSAKLDPVPLEKFNDFSEAYGKFHFQKGTLLLVCELAAKDGQVEGYIKPLLDNIAIIDTRDLKNPLKFTWESMVAGAARLLRNQPNNRFATKIPISGSLKDPQASILVILGNILKNAFIHVFNGNFDNSGAVKEIKKENNGVKP